MIASTQLCCIPERWRERALALDEVCTDLERCLDGHTLEQALRIVCNRHAGRVLRDGGKVCSLPLSEVSLKRHFYGWRKSGKNPLAFVPKYKPGKVKIPGALITDLTRRCTTEGRASDRIENVAPVSYTHLTLPTKA